MYCHHVLYSHFKVSVALRSLMLMWKQFLCSCQYYWQFACSVIFTVLFMVFRPCSHGLVFICLMFMYLYWLVWQSSLLTVISVDSCLCWQLSVWLCRSISGFVSCRGVGREILNSARCSASCTACYRHFRRAWHAGKRSWQHWSLAWAVLRTAELHLINSRTFLLHSISRWAVELSNLGAVLPKPQGLLYFTVFRSR